MPEQPKTKHPDDVPETAEPQPVWRSPKEPPFHLAGFAWFERDRVYRRLPVAPAETIREPVDRLANCTAGGQVRFRTDSRKLTVRVTLAAPADMDHMPASGQCGFDCYLGPPGRQHYLSTTRYSHQGATYYEHVLYDLARSQMRHVTLNFPLYMGVQELLIRLDPEADVLPPAPYDTDARIVVYGTSITQGGCASRPGMCYTNILSRRINLEFINLGFSGNGRGEPEVARIISTIDRPVLFVLDYEANAGGTEPFRRTFPEFIRILREAHPDVPILALSRVPSAGELVNPNVRSERIERRDFQRTTVDALRKKGDRNVHFLDGSDLLGERWDECTVDGAHPTDLGFLRMADGIEPVIRRILQGK